MIARGGGWVVAQFALMLLVFLAVLVPPDWPDGVNGPFVGAGVVLALVGIALFVWAARMMGRGLTPFPEPPPDARLIDGGPFRYVRHPTYSGALALLCGWSLFAGPVALGLTGGLALLWVGKMRVEERRLRARFPGYDEYTVRVRYRLLPGVF